MQKFTQQHLSLIYECFGCSSVTVHGQEMAALLILLSSVHSVLYFLWSILDFLFNPHSGFILVLFVCVAYLGALHGLRPYWNVSQWCQDNIHSKWMQGLFVTWTISRTCQRVVKSDHFCMKNRTLIRRQQGLTLKYFPAHCHLHRCGLASAEWSPLFGMLTEESTVTWLRPVLLIHDCPVSSATRPKQMWSLQHGNVFPANLSPGKTTYTFSSGVAFEINLFSSH